MAGESQKVPSEAPDPSVYTYEAIDRSMRALREWTEAQLEVRDERFNGIDKATQLLNETVNRVPTDVQQAVGHLRELTMVELQAIALQFKERDTRSERESRDNKTAVDAAFSAQKEAASEQNKSNTLAIDKSEKATTETLNKLSELFKTTTDGLAANINDLKSRMDRMEATMLGAIAQRTEGRQSNTAVYATIGAIATVISILIVVVGMIVNNAPS